MEDQDHDNLETAAPPLSASKQTRILIWRDEVASSTSDDQHSQQQRTSDAASSSATSTTTSSSSSRPALLLSRGRQLFSRLARRLSAQGDGPEAPQSTSKFTLRGRRRSAVEPPSRTAMYAALSPDNAAAWTADADADDEGDEEEPKMDAKLREKQERLMRAARLLDQGVAN
ncbi:hypothetical protein K4F52_001042 [Lecanicillium sp. MT-2017a]|nr:hypothetical protein K4F52_001042 [Lecanicillium sp. MT-2017a]